MRSRLALPVHLVQVAQVVGQRLLGILDHVAGSTNRIKEGVLERARLGLPALG